MTQRATSVLRTETEQKTTGSPGPLDKTHQREEEQWQLLT